MHASLAPRTELTHPALETKQAHDSPLTSSIAQLTNAGLIAHFANRKSVAYPELPRATESQLSYADDILANCFTYTGETFQFEPEFSWKPNPSRDKEWQIAFHKHYFLIDLIQAYRESGNVAYLQKWQHLIESWIAEMSSGYITLSDAQVEAKRVESWCTSYMLLQDTKWHEHIRGDFLRQMLTRVADETLYISKNLKRVRNHRTFQLYAIFMVGVLFPELSLHSHFLTIGTELLSDNLLTDFQEDGVHIEMSSHYHQLVAETGARMVELAVLNNVKLRDELVERLHKAVRFSLYLQWPNGDIPLINDSDNGNHLDLLRLGSRYFNDAELMWGATLGKDGSAPKAASQCFNESGYFILGDTWGSNEYTYAQRQHVFYDCGKLGEGSHSHYDLFNFCYYVNGEPAIIDPGRYTYSGEPDADGILWRHYFKGTAAHNTVTIDRLDQTEYLNRTKHGPDIVLAGREHHLGQHADWISGRATSQNYSPQHERLFVYMGHDYLFILDRLFSDDQQDHHYALNFHLPAEASSSLIQHGNGFQLITKQCEIFAASTTDITGNVESGWVSQYYGVKYPAPIFSVTQTGSGNRLFASLVAPSRSDGFEIVSSRIHTIPGAKFCFITELKKKGQHFQDCFILTENSKSVIEHQGLVFRGNFLACRSNEKGEIIFVSAQAATLLSISGKVIHQHPTGANVEWPR
jgi:hypothetical protein